MAQCKPVSLCRAIQRAPSKNHGFMRTIARELLEEPNLLLARLEEGWRSDRPSKMSPPRLAAFTSGSAVIASELLMEQVATYHRRVSGLDMEIYAIHRAAHVAHCKPDVLCAKVVVDLAGGDKNDSLHAYGSTVSAKFVIEALTSYFGRHP
jgi:adenosylhomocysteine nucleosidase